MAKLRNFHPPPWGFLVTDLHLKKEVLKAAVKETTKESRVYTDVFKIVGDNELDTHHAQSRYSCRTAATKEIASYVTAVTQGLDENWKASEFSFLRSLSGGKPQYPHADYILDDIARSKAIYPNSLPVSVVVASMSGIHLRVFARCFDQFVEESEEVIDLQPGQCVIFRGDHIHSGVAYSVENYRIHYYLSLPKDKKWEADIVTGVVEAVMHCDFCQKMVQSQRALTQHVQMCSKNPDAEQRLLKRKVDDIKSCSCKLCDLSFKRKSTLRKHLQTHTKAE